MRRAAVAAGLCMALATTGARAEWKRVQGGGQDYLLSVSVTPAGELFTGGFTLDQGSQLPIPKAALFASGDRGKTLEPIGDALGGGGFGNLGVVGPVAFADASTGLVVMDKAIHRTSDRGATWQSAELAAVANDVHLFDAQKAIAVGDGGLVARTDDGGASWSPQPSGTTADLHCMYWLDAERGFAAGYTQGSETDWDGKETTTYGEGVVLSTTDGGATWATGYTTSGLVLCPIFFLPDAAHGWLAAVTGAEGGHGTATLLATSDGGATFTDMAVPTEVGTMKMFIEAKIHASSFTAMFWADTMNGHLGGSAYVTEVSGGSSPKPIFRTVDFLTRDGGATWQKTDLGTIELNIMGGQTPSGDGATISGHMASLLDGVMVGEGTGIWVYEGACAADAECGSNATCSAGLCATREPPPGGCAGTDCSVGSGGGGQGAGGGAGGEDAMTGGPGGESSGVAPSSGGDGGCQAAASGGPRSLGFAALALVLGALGRRRPRVSRPPLRASAARRA